MASSTVHALYHRRQMSATGNHIFPLERSLERIMISFGCTTRGQHRSVHFSERPHGPTPPRKK